MSTPSTPAPLEPEPEHQHQTQHQHQHRAQAQPQPQPQPVPQHSEMLDERLPAERTHYSAGALADDAPADPIALAATWLQDAFDRRDQHRDLPEPSAAVLSTVMLGADRIPRPRSRTVLIKGLDELGFTLFTNLDSDKAREAQSTPFASLLLPWYPLQRQVRIEGRIGPVPAEESDAYWAQRPRGSQLGAWASRQSRPIGSRADLETQFAVAEARFGDSDVPRPPFWGGLRVVPHRFEFWQGRGNRFHDRIVFERPTGRSTAPSGAGTGWTRWRLQP